MNCIVWIFGRGASVACNLRWTVPSEWIAYERPLQVEKIRAAILEEEEMDRPEVNTEPYRLLLSELSRRTAPGWQHRFFTTNWDYLLQREILRLGLQVVPPWLTETHVFHLNGTVENTHVAGLPSLRSPFLLERDRIRERTPSEEFRQALQFIVWRKHFIVIGVSFSCPTDQALLAILHAVEGDLPVGGSWWHVVDPSPNTALEVCSRIKQSLPRAAVTLSQKCLKEWLTEGMPALTRRGLLADT